MKTSKKSGKPLIKSLGKFELLQEKPGKFKDSRERKREKKFFADPAKTAGKLEKLILCVYLSPGIISNSESMLASGQFGE